MSRSRREPDALPPGEQVRRAIELYLARAYPQGVPEAAGKFQPSDGADPAEWLMGAWAERDPPDAPLENVRSFSLRIGNAKYPHMKLRLSRPPCEGMFLLSVDSHDAFLHAATDSPDCLALEELKRYNAEVASAVHADWDAAGLPTERSYLRGRLRRARTDESPPGEPDCPREG